MIVDLFIPCFVDQIYPGIGVKMIKLLEKIDLSVNYNTEQTCCGQVAFNNGYWDHAKCVGEKFIKEFSMDRYIVSPSASCVAMVRNYYTDLFYNTALHNEYKQLQRNIYEFSDFVVNVMKVNNFNSRFNGKVTFHDSCSALREYGIKEQPRTLLKNVKGLELVEMNDSEVCCGFGGTFAVKFEPISTAMAQQKLNNAINTSAEYIVSTEASCLMHLEGYVNKHNLPIKPIHLIEILASGN